MTDTSPAARAPTVPRIARSFPRRAGVTLRLRWRAYWECRVRRATAVILHKLDDRTLADIGVDRDEIDSLVDGRRAVDDSAVDGETESDARREPWRVRDTAAPRFVSRDSARRPRARFPARARS